MLPPEDVERARRWAEQRVPERARHQVRVEIETSDQAITIVERRAPWRDDLGPEWTRHPIARLRYTSKRGEWTLYRPGRNLKFHHYDLATPSADIARTPRRSRTRSTSIFWG